MGFVIIDQETIILTSVMARSPQNLEVKQVVGKTLAKAGNVPFIDKDSRINAKYFFTNLSKKGKPITHILREKSQQLR